MFEAMFEMRGLASVGPFVVAAIVAKAVGYAAALVAAGGVLYLSIFPETEAVVQAIVRRVSVVAALMGSALLALSLGLTAARMSGMGMAGSVDPMMLSFAWESPLGTSAALRWVGFALVFGLFVPGKAGTALALCGACAIIVSYAFVGHSLGEPRWLLAALLVVHLLAAAFWVGALVPLWRVADTGVEGAAILHRFGKIAAWTVTVLVAVGLAYAWQLSGSPLTLVGTAYGAVLLAKIASVGLLLGLAAANKLRLVPALAKNQPKAGAALRRSIVLEGSLVICILLLTAILTSVTTPPVNF